VRVEDVYGRMAQLMEAIGRLGPGQPGAWTQDPEPRPTVDALRAVTGAPVSAGERDLAWSAYRLSQATAATSPAPATAP
jgi:hypothetical protein